MFVPRISNLDNQRLQVTVTSSHHSQHHHINYSVYATYDTTYPSTSLSTISLKLLICSLSSCLFGPLYYIYFILQHTALRGGYPYLKCVLESHRLWTRLQYLYKYISYTVCPISSIMQLGQKWECSQLTYSTAAGTMSNNQVGGRAGACQHNNTNQNQQNITHHPNISSQFKPGLLVEGGGILLTTFAPRLRISISWIQNQCGRSIPSSFATYVLYMYK